MAQTGFTPIQLYRTTTAAAVPTAGNLAAGELAINLTDKKLYTKDASNNVFLLADASSGGTTAANLSGGLAGSLPYQSAPNTTLFLSIGAANRVLTSTGTAPQWVNSLTGLTGVSSSGLTNTSLTSGRLVYSTTGGAQTDSANLTFDGTRLTVADFADSSLTSGRVPYASTGGALTDSANLLYAGADLTVYGVRVGRGAGAVSTNTAVGASALNANTIGTNNVGLGSEALQANIGASNNTAVGYQAAYSNTAGASNTAIGSQALYNATGSGNIAIGHLSGTGIRGGAENIALGNEAMRIGASTGGNYNIAIGGAAGYRITTGAENVFIGSRITTILAASGYNTTTGSGNVGVGNLSLASNTTGGNNVAIGLQSLYSNTTASNNTAVGYQAAISNTTGARITAIGYQALYAHNGATGYNTAVGYQALDALTSGYDNVAVGDSALGAVTTGTSNTAVGNGTLVAATSNDNTAVGLYAANKLTSGAGTTSIGVYSLRDITTGNYNTAIGQYSGYLITTGAKNTIIGSYSGNQGGLDIRTASNYIVLSDGDGNPRAYWNGANPTFPGNINFSGAGFLFDTTDGISVPKTVTAAGTTGAQTINKTAGTVNFAAAATSLVVTNSFVDANSIIIATVGADDTTMKSVAAVAAAGSFTLYANAAATAETRVNFMVIN